jgi:hypothetical protein
MNAREAEAHGEIGVIQRVGMIALLAAVSGACATTQSPQPARALTAQAFERAKAFCRVTDATLSDDGEHLSIVFPGPSPDRARQSHCLFEWNRANGFWVDQIVTEHANDEGA